MSLSRTTSSHIENSWLFICLFSFPFPIIYIDWGFLVYPKQVQMYVDSREKVTARYQVISQIDQIVVSLYLFLLSQDLVYWFHASFAFITYNAANMSIKEGSHGVWKLQANRHSFTESSQGLGLANSSVIWRARRSSPKRGLKSGCSCAACLKLN